jgi:hypothetical protein
LTIRDNSKVKLKDNKMFANFYQLSMLGCGKAQQEEILDDNAIEGLNEFHSEICNIF